MSPKSKKVLAVILGILIVIALLLLAGAWKAGIFEEPEITLELRGPHHYVYLQKTGDFSMIAKAYEEADGLFKDQSIDKGTACGMYLDDPAMVQPEDMRWRVGYLVSDSMEVNAPLEYLIIPNTEYAVASIDAHPMVAPFKTYPALQEWVKTSEYQFIGPAYEIYNENGIIEVLFPVEKRK